MKHDTLKTTITKTEDTRLREVKREETGHLLLSKLSNKKSQENYVIKL